MTSWQEGDIVGPTNLNSKVPTWFTTGSSASSTVNFVFNVKTDFGATGDGTTDDWASIQSAVDAAGASFARPYKGGGTVYFPPGDYSLSKPIWVRKGFSVRLWGLGRDQFSNGDATLFPTYQCGPAIAYGPDNSAHPIPTAPAIVGSVGSSFVFSAATDYWLNARDSTALEINGLTAFTAECFWKPDDTTIAPNIFSSTGKWLPSDAIPTAFDVHTSGVGLLGHQFQTSNTTVNATVGYTLSTNSVYHIAQTYDGVNVRLFIGEPGKLNTLASTVSASGAIVQKPSEDVMIGKSFQLSPEQSFVRVSPYGKINSVRYSNICRYTSAFTPVNSKLTKDNNTLLLVDPDGMFENGLVQTQSSLGTGWLVPRGSVMGAPGNPDIRDFFVNGNGGYCGAITFSGFCTYPRVERIRGTSLRFGVHIGDQSHFGRYQELYFSAPSGNTQARYGINFPTLAQGDLVDFPSIEGNFVCQIISFTDLTITNPFFSADSSTVFFLVSAGQNSFNNVTVIGGSENIETEVGHQWRGAMACASGNGPSSLVLVGHTVVSGNQAYAPPILVDRGNFTMVGGTLVSFSSTTLPVAWSSTVSAPAGSAVAAQFIGVSQKNGIIPWSDSTGNALVISQRSEVSTGQFTPTAQFLSLSTTNSSGNSTSVIDGEVRVVAVSATSAQIGIRSGNTTYLFNAAGTAV